jgi:Fe2+ transport system protein FeoA
MSGNSASYVSLAELAAGSRAVVREVCGGKTFAGRLASLGLVAGSDLEVLQNSQDGPMLVRAHNTRVALGRNEARKVLVEELNE